KLSACFSPRLEAAPPSHLSRRAACRLPGPPPVQQTEGIPMQYSIRNGTARLGTAAAVLGLSLLACDRPGLLEPDRAEVARYAAARNRCRLVSGSAFDGTGSSGALAGTGRGVYDCPLVGTVRVSVSFQVSATQG